MSRRLQFTWEDNKNELCFLFILLFVIPLYTQQKIVRADRENTRTLLLSEHEQSGHKKSDSP
ncbi:hypothetical protein F6Y03_06365 [Bacillus megaterium]|nr:hypothetical protein [Priestia megaterium]